MVKFVGINCFISFDFDYISWSRFAYYCLQLGFIIYVGEATEIM